jgi:sarcosine oxidase, subunit gamma
VTGEAFARSPVEDRSDDLRTIGARPVPFLAQTDLRIDPRNATRSPYPLPVEPNTSTELGDVEALWLGPDEWLIVCPSGSASDVASALETALSDVGRSIVDVSANRVAIELFGRDRFELLSHVCSLDLERPAWEAGRCAQTLVGRAYALLHERSDGTRIFVRPSFVGYLVDLLLEVRTVTRDVRA